MSENSLHVTIAEAAAMIMATKSTSAKYVRTDEQAPSNRMLHFSNPALNVYVGMRFW